MNRLQTLKKSLSDLPYEEQLSIVEARRDERITKPIKKVSLRKSKPKVSEAEKQQRVQAAKIKTVDELLSGKSPDELAEIAKRLGVNL